MLSLRRACLCLLYTAVLGLPGFGAGPPMEILARGQKPGPLALDLHWLYWGNADGSLRRVSVRGGQVETLVPGGHTYQALRLDEAYLYWLDPSKKKLYRLARKGGEPVALADLHDEPQALTDDRDSLYWTERPGFAGRPGNLGIMDPGGRVLQVPKAGGPTRVVAEGQQGPGDVTVDQDSVYWICMGSRTVVQGLKQGGPVRQLFEGSPGWSLAVDAKALYFTDNGSDMVRRVELKSGAQSILAQGLRFPDFLGQTQDDLYFTSAGGGGLRRLSKQGGPMTVLNPKQYGPFALGQGYVYFADQSGNLCREPW